MQGLFIENFHILGGLSPSTDVYNTNPASDVVNMSYFESLIFLVIQKANATSTAGTASIKPQAVSSVAASNAEDLPFHWSKKTTGASSVWSTPVAVAAASSITTTANEDTIYAIEVQNRVLPDAKKYVQLKLTEVVNAPVLGSVIVIGNAPRFGAPFSLDALA